MRGLLDLGYLGEVFEMVVESCTPTDEDPRVGFLRQRSTLYDRSQPQIENYYENWWGPCPALQPETLVAVQGSQVRSSSGSVSQEDCRK
jgi:hypothetical protein